MKSIKVKITNKDSLILTPIIEWYATLTSQLERNILILAGRSATNRDGVLVIDGEKERHKLCNGNINLIGDCYFVYKSFVNGNARTFASWFMGGRDMGDTSNKGPKPKKEKTPEQIEQTKKLKDALLNLESNGILPFKINNNGIDYLNTNPTYKWAVVGEVHAKLSSYETQIESTKQEYDELQSKLNTCESKLFGKYSDSIKNDFKAFISDCETHNHRINYKFTSFLRNQGGNYTRTYGHWINHKDEKRRYFIKQEILDSLSKYKSIIEGDNSLLLSTQSDDMDTYTDLVFRFKNKKEVPTYTAISKDTCKLLLGNNYIPFKVIQVGDQLIWTIKSPQGKSDTNDGKFQFITNHKRVGRGKHFQLENLKITPFLKKESENPDGNYGIEWSTNGKQHFTGKLKEPNIILRKNGMFVQLPITIEKDEKLERICGKIRTSLNRAYPVQSSNKKQKSIKYENKELDIALKELGRPLNVMGIDLGLRGIATSNISFDGYVKSAPQTTYIKGDIAERISMANLVKSINKLKEVINLTSEFYKLENASELYNECDADERLYLDDLSIMKKSGIKLNELKHHKNNWTVSHKYGEIKKEFTRLKVNRLTTYDFLNLPFWANTLKQFINLSKSYLWVGMESPKKKGNAIQNAFATSDFFRTYQELYNNIKEDYAKKVANYIVTSAVKNNIDIITVEELSSNLGHKDYKTKQENEMFLMWNCGRIKFHIENMAGDYGIVVTEVNEFETSQVHYETNNYGYRDEDNNEILWYENSKGIMESTHADKNAASNIANRFLSQHTNVFSYPIIRDNDIFKYTY